jgi:hypothetical protein
LFHLVTLLFLLALLAHRDVCLVTLTKAAHFSQVKRVYSEMQIS